LQINSLRNTIRLLKDELWQMKMQLSSNDLAKLTLPTKPDEKSNEIAQLYKNSTLLLNVKFDYRTNDLFVYRS